ncbi:hypothetical protein [Methylibium sp.]|uniref:hypothetical protein n=1 Tax=Methylibium sp. TaxID=2067992 RepID=UPI0017A77E89|nr:hypothetical protein [Methylibium sp.]MBA3590308.1 hypothetical protein [Methylibium sp.]
MLGSPSLSLTLFAGHDLALPLLRETARRQGLHLDVRFLGSVDGLRALAAVVNTEAGRQMLLVYGHDGAPPSAREGPVALLALGDPRSGPRHVRNVLRIDVRILRD